VRERRILITDLELGALSAHKRLFDATDHYDRTDVSLSRPATCGCRKLGQCDRSAYGHGFAGRAAPGWFHRFCGGRVA
jgi:hypothetical protein